MRWAALAIIIVSGIIPAVSQAQAPAATAPLIVQGTLVSVDLSGPHPVATVSRPSSTTGSIETWTADLATASSAPAGEGFRIGDLVVIAGRVPADCAGGCRMQAGGISYQADGKPVFKGPGGRLIPQEECDVLPDCRKARELSIQASERARDAYLRKQQEEQAAGEIVARSALTNSVERKDHP